MSHLEKLLKQAQSQVNFMNFDGSGYNENFESLDAYTQAELMNRENLEIQNLVQAGENLNVAQGIARLRVNMAANQLKSIPASTLRTAEAIASGALAQIPSASETPFQPMPRTVRGDIVASTFTLRIKRLTANITEDLPVVLFGKTFSLTGYVSLIQSLLPSGVTLTAVQIGLNNSDTTLLSGTLANSAKIRFHFEDSTSPTTNKDIIEVTCNEVPVPVFVDATGTDPFSVKSLRYKISDSAQQAQFDIPLSFKRKTNYGKGGEQTLTPSTYVNSTDFKDDLIQIGQPFEIDKDSWVETKLVQSAGFQVTLSFNVDMFVRQGANLL